MKYYYFTGTTSSSINIREGDFDGVNSIVPLTSFQPSPPSDFYDSGSLLTGSSRVPFVPVNITYPADASETTFYPFLAWSLSQIACKSCSMRIVAKFSQNFNSDTLLRVLEIGVPNTSGFMTQDWDETNPANFGYIYGNLVYGQTLSASDGNISLATNKNPSRLLKGVQQWAAGLGATEITLDTLSLYPVFTISNSYNISASLLVSDIIADAWLSKIEMVAIRPTFTYTAADLEVDPGDGVTRVKDSVYKSKIDLLANHPSRVPVFG